MTTQQTPNGIEQWRELAQQLRVDSIRCTTAAGSGHPTSSMSAADLMAVLQAKYLRYDFDHPKRPENDHLIFSKGHASPLLYAMYRAAGAVSDEELLSLRKLGSRLEGHPVPILPYVDVATGSLGQGLPIAVGIALAGKRLDKLPFRVWCLLGDSEVAEGSIWEAFDKASVYGLDNLTGILDVNRLGQRGETEFGWHTEVYEARAKSFGWHAIVVDGHDLAAIDAAYDEATRTTDRPTLVIARTHKGHGVSFLDDKPGKHGQALKPDEAKAAIQELGGERHLTVKPQLPDAAPRAETPPGGKLELPVYAADKQVATRRAYGDALKAVGAARGDVVALDAEVSNSTFAEIFAGAFPERFFEMWIAEQQLVATAVGMQVRGYKPFASTFAAFFSRAYDFIRMAAISRANIKLAGSHAGVSIGEDGPSQMALEDLAMMRAVFGSTVLYPCDPNQTAALVAEMVDEPGIVYMRTTRAAGATIYGAGEAFKIGGSRVVRRSDSDRATIVAAGITVHEALKAADTLAAEGTHVRVVDAYSVKPIDAATLQACAREAGDCIVVVEDHWPEGGLGDAVLSAFPGSLGPIPCVVKLGVQDMPGSGTPDQLLDAAGISAPHIAEAVRLLLVQRGGG